MNPALEQYVAEHREPLPWSTDPALAEWLMTYLAKMDKVFINIIPVPVPDSEGGVSICFVGRAYTNRGKLDAPSAPTLALAVCRAAIAASTQTKAQE